ncbi:hypothetical protein KPATCC21470_5811 [Kitasatospora purpeofusca]
MLSPWWFGVGGGPPSWSLPLATRTAPGGPRLRSRAAVTDL